MGCEGSKMQRTNEPVGTLHYFDVYSRGEQIRLLLSHANVNYTDRRIQIADWPNIKPTMPGNQLPVWESNGKMMNETSAVLRYLGKLYGYYP